MFGLIGKAESVFFAHGPTQVAKYGLETLAREVTRVRTGNAYELSTAEGNVQR